MNQILLNEELYKMKHLFGYKKGVVISEQEYNSPDWRGKSKGDLDLTNPYGKYAINVGYGKSRYTLTSISTSPRLTGDGNKKVDETPPVSTPPKTTLSPLKLSDSAFPYPDNMIGPKFDSFPDAKEVYTDFVKKLSQFIKSGGLDSIKSLSIQGTADSARPTLDIPKGYTSLDHNLVGDTTPYGGEKDDSKRNQYLADNRAKVLGDMIVSYIKTSNNVDITNKIKYEPGINYYGQPSKRGFDFKKVTVTPNYTEINIKVGETPGTSTKGTTTKPEVNKSQTSETNMSLDLTPYGSKIIPAKMITRGSGQVAAISRKVSDENSLVSLEKGGILPIWTTEGMNGNPQVKGEIKGDEFFVNNLSFGKIVYINPNEISTDYNNQAESTTRYVTTGRPVVVGGDNEYDYIRVIKLAFSEL